jgi:aspartyl-tRNA(Asn)/glutamyl-tRNA(Gln) amidotransferase subunit C
MAKIDKAALDHIAELSKLSFTDEETEKMIDQMSNIITFMDTIREIDIQYDDAKDNNQISYARLREDKAGESFPTEKLLQNAHTGGDGDCYVLPKMME